MAAISDGDGAVYVHCWGGHGIIGVVVAVSAAEEETQRRSSSCSQHPPCPVVGVHHDLHEVVQAADGAQVVGAVPQRLAAGSPARSRSSLTASCQSCGFAAETNQVVPAYTVPRSPQDEPSRERVQQEEEEVEEEEEDDDDAEEEAEEDDEEEEEEEEMQEEEKDEDGDEDADAVCVFRYTGTLWANGQRMSATCKAPPFGTSPRAPPPGRRPTWSSTQLPATRSRGDASLVSRGVGLHGMFMCVVGMCTAVWRVTPGRSRG